MSRLDRTIEAKEEARIDLVELLAAFAPGQGDDGARRAAMACFLSASKGWRDAAGTLGGTFAEPLAGTVRLTPEKE